MKIQTQPGFVLHRQPLETGQEQFELFTPDLGRLRFRRPIGERPLPLFQCLDLDFKGRGSSHQLRSWVPSGPLYHLPGHRLYFGLYLNELISKLWPREGESATLFGLYSSTLTLIAKQHQELPALRYFERMLLAELGYAIEFSVSVEGLPVRGDGHYRHVIGRGFTQVPADTDSILGAYLLGIARNDWHTPDTLHHARVILSREIDGHLEGKTLHTRDLMRHHRTGGKSDQGVSE